LAILAAAGFYLSGSLSFREASVNRFLAGWEEDTRRGDADAACETLAQDMTFSVHEHIGARAQDAQGNRDEFCSYLHKSIPLLAKQVASTDVTRDHFTVTRDALHWWTANVSYTEHRDLTLVSGLHLKQVSEDHVTLVKTLKGLRLERLESDARLER
jgi:hypothetical protein